MKKAEDAKTTQQNLTRKVLTLKINNESTVMSDLQRELQQNVPFASPAQEAVIALLRTTSLIRRCFTALLEPHGLTFPQYNVLRILRGAGEPLPTMEISERMIEATPGITRLVDGLEKKGLLARERSAEDRRQVLCRLTPAGHDLLSNLDGPIDALDARSLSMLSEEEQRDLTALMSKIRSELS